MRKDVYVDGHERPDVIEDRQKKFLNEMHQLSPYFVEFEPLADVTIDLHVIVKFPQLSHCPCTK